MEYSQEIELNYEQDMYIDPEGLDICILEQPTLMMKYSRILAQAEKISDQAKEKLDQVTAELDNKIRTKPGRFGVEKVTEGAVKAVILTRPRYQESNAELMEAKYNAKVIQGAVKAIEQRKSALENLVKLHGQQYFAGPSIPRDLSKEWIKAQEEKNFNAKIKIKRRKET